MSEQPVRRPQADGIWPPETLLAEEIVEATLDLVISLVTYPLEDACGASVTLLCRASGEFHTPSATSTDTREVDAVQYETDQGPCVEAVRTGQPVNVVLPLEGPRWAEFTAEAARRGFASVLSVPLRDGERVIGALNVYSHRPRAFAPHDQRAVGDFARRATVVLRHASEFMTRDWLDEQVAEALSRADVIGQAKGILIAKGYSADEALATLRRASDRTNRTLSDVAQDMVTSGRRVRTS